MNASPAPAATSVPALVTYPMERQVRYRALDFTYIANVVDDPGGIFVRAESPLRNAVVQQQHEGQEIEDEEVGAEDHG